MNIPNSQFCDVATETVTLELRRIGMASIITDRITTEYAIETGKTFARGYAGVFVQKVEKIEYKWPSNWWQHVKERFAPKWFLGKYPVVYSRKGHEVGLFYPDIAIPEYKQSHKVFITKTSGYNGY